MSPIAQSATCDRLLRVEGIVQGVGFRPFVATLATRLGVRGWVRNDSAGVSIRALAPAAALDAFVAALTAEAPPAARISSVREVAPDGDADAVGQRPTPPPLPPVCERQGCDGAFAILESPGRADVATVELTPDLALCDDCLRELLDPADRRHGYPFINCTRCGPRYTILTALPYDRVRTTMSEFTLCPACAREYADPRDRRYHAEPNACPVCGPRLAILGPDGSLPGGDAARDDAGAIAAAAAALRSGYIVAVKGIGGFHLMVDACNEPAAAELRRRKHREEKPLAVMFPSVSELRHHATVSDEDLRQLSSSAAPIVLVRRRADSTLARSVAPGNPLVGALLPHAPLQVLLLRAVGRPVVATSGNLSEEPLCYDNAEARKRLGAIADLFVVHDRAIAQPVDDSVMRPTNRGPIVLRSSRGLAPSSFELPADAADGEPLLCVGGHLKNTVAMTVGSRVVVSPHIGDLGNPHSMAAFRRTIDLLRRLHGAEPTRVVCDAHPDYASTRFAEALGLPVVRVQHHLAHVLACLLEHGGGPERVLGVAWDGTGYGSDGTIWGGEFIIVDTRAGTARRVAHLRPFRLPGGEQAIREPRRSALGVLAAAVGADMEEFDTCAGELGFTPEATTLLRGVLASGAHAPTTTSVGRLFDAVAALLSLRSRCSFEGQAAMELEFAADGATSCGSEAGRAWPIPLVASAEGRLSLDWGPMIEVLWRERLTTTVGELAARFHDSLARAVGDVAEAVGVGSVALSGGCFQNARLLAATEAELTRRGHAVLRHRALPPNDGGISAGQALAARRGLCEVT